MQEITAAGLIILIITAIVSYKGIKDSSFLDSYSFHVDEILVNKDFKRLITSGFLHLNWIHLGLNMLTFYFFSYSLEMTVGVENFLIIYFASLIGGNLFALFIHRNHADYSAVGASGAISGLVFASIALFPGIEIGFLLIPISIPGWAYGLLYVLVSIYGIKSKFGNIGHEAHLGGGLIGLLIAIFMMPQILILNPVPILFILIPSLIFLFMIIKKPEILLIENFFSGKGFRTIEDNYNLNKRSKEKELDLLLDKINRKGLKSLTKKEREKLNQLSH